jgi:hypothetical protein
MSNFFVDTGNNLIILRSRLKLCSNEELESILENLKKYNLKDNYALDFSIGFWIDEINFEMESRLNKNIVDTVNESYIYKNDEPWINQMHTDANHGPDIPEGTPTPNALPGIWDIVIKDMKTRDLMGQQKYKTKLQPFNGRDALWDAYQEALDLVVYLRQAIYERDGK